MPSIAQLSSYTTPKEPFERNRETHPYLLGDVFNNDKGEEFTLFYISEGIAYGVMINKEGDCYLKKFSNWLDLFSSGFKQNMEYVQKEKEMEGWGLYAPRKLQDGTWVAITRLMYTTAICANFDEYTMYESRYCFSHTETLPSWSAALFWMAQFKTKKSLPITNCAYRGYLGTEPIYDEEKTLQYYQDLKKFKLYDTVNDLSLHEYASKAMEDVVQDYQSNIKIKKKAERKEMLDKELQQAAQSVGLEYDPTTQKMHEYPVVELKETCV